MDDVNIRTLNYATDGSSTIANGGTSQTVFGGVVPKNGYAIDNPHATNDLWITDSAAAAAANEAGCIRVAANGGHYETPVGYKPFGVVRIVAALTGQKFTAKSW